MATCEQCGKEFVIKQKHNKNRFCSKECWYKSRGLTCTCGQCGKVFRIRQRKEGPRFCSRECFYASMRKPDMILTCLQCGEEYERRPCDVRRGQDKYCSPQCFHKSLVGATRPNLRVAYERICPACGKKFFVGGRRYGNKDQVLCSWKCQYGSRHRHGKTATELTGQHPGYIAGLMDGEGSIMLVERHGRVFIRLNVANTYKDVLDWLVDVTGIGRVYMQREAGPKWKAAYSWRAFGDGAESLLKQIRPYLIIKAKQADLALETQERLRNPAMKMDRTWQEEYRQQMKAMNKRGPSS